ncbi:MAG TPA: tetraacyldisaccharide 4'-kinase [Vicinamibacteria bacterium]|nr:tetraacyldisaccharide 4'-kinase [Vicinamibacteria bacterium]
MRLLLPLGIAYGALGALRVAAYRAGLLPSLRPEGPVISVGNLSVGGSGKTPVVEWIARTLRDAALPVAILSRGYGGAYAGGPQVVSDGDGLRMDARSAGDEPVMLARALSGVPVLIGRRRDAAALLAERLFGRRVHVLDDGFQHLRLRRDLDLVCATPEDLRDWPLPAGRLREFPRSVARAHGVLLTEDGPGPGGVETWRVTRRVLGAADLDGREQRVPRSAWLVCGIARPERFVADAAACGVAVAGRDVFRDHHRFSDSDWAGVAARAVATGAEAILTTAKDAVRLPPAARSGPPVRVLRVGVQFADEESFRERLLRVARRAA